ncbi:unnamed protein product [Amoebophrya sp. A120]|nr:unnamed protein product [Amoebophrya sp. A120]|eukprot:GSA120T00016343001.1
MLRSVVSQVRAKSGPAAGKITAQGGARTSIAKKKKHNAENKATSPTRNGQSTSCSAPEAGQSVSSVEGMTQSQKKRKKIKKGHNINGVDAVPMSKKCDEDLATSSNTISITTAETTSREKGLVACSQKRQASGVLDVELESKSKKKKQKRKKLSDGSVAGKQHLSGTPGGSTSSTSTRGTTPRLSGHQHRDGQEEPVPAGAENKPSNLIIDDIFASANKRRKLDDGSTRNPATSNSGSTITTTTTKKSKRQARTAAPPTTSTPGSATDLFGYEAESRSWKNDGLGGIYDQNGWTNRRLNDNTKIYKAHLIGERDKPGAGTTKLCPFDCDCCFGFAETEMEGFLKKESAKVKEAAIMS